MKMKIFSVVALILVGIVAVFVVISSKLSVETKYIGYINAARSSAAEGIPYVAIQNYMLAMQIDGSSEDIYCEYKEQCKLLEGAFYDTAIKEYIVRFPNSVKAYEELCTYYYELENYKSVINTALEAKNAGAVSENIKNYYMECAYMYKYMRTGFEEAGTFLGDSALVKVDGVYGYLKSSGSYLIAPLYQDANVFLDASTAVCTDKNWYIINQAGYMIAKPKEAVDYMSFVNNGKILVSKNGKYAYMDKDLNVPKEFPYEEASIFKNNIAAVKKDGKWALIDNTGKNITDYVFEDIVFDEYKTCINNGVIFAKYEGKYYLMNNEGAKISADGFDNACPFASTEMAAVCIKDKWGFIDAAGNMVIEPQYEDAKSFASGLGAVCKNGMWGYIDSENIIRIDFQFDNCKSFSMNGIAAVEENHNWNYIKLLAYEK